MFTNDAVDANEADTTVPLKKDAVDANDAEVTVPLKNDAVDANEELTAFDDVAVNDPFMTTEPANVDVYIPIWSIPPFVTSSVSFPLFHERLDDAVAAFVVPSDNNILPIDALFIIFGAGTFCTYDAVVANEELTLLST